MANMKLTLDTLKGPIRNSCGHSEFLILNPKERSLGAPAQISDPWIVAPGTSSDRSLADQYERGDFDSDFQDESGEFNYDITTQYLETLLQSESFWLHSCALRHAVLLELDYTLKIFREQADDNQAFDQQSAATTYKHFTTLDSRFTTIGQEPA